MNKISSKWQCRASVADSMQTCLNNVVRVPKYFIEHLDRILVELFRVIENGKESQTASTGRGYC